MNSTVETIDRNFNTGPFGRCEWDIPVQKRHCSAFTLVEVIASVVLIVIILTTILIAYQNTLDKVGNHLLRERAFSVAQRHMETLIATPQEPNSINVPVQDEIEPMFDWKLDLTRITVGDKEKKAFEVNVDNTVIQAKVTVTSNIPELNEPINFELIRYFSNMKPAPGKDTAVDLPNNEEAEDVFQNVLEQLEKMRRNAQTPEEVEQD